MRTAVFTIASRNYFAHVNTLMQSLESTNPAYDRFVVCVDELSPDFVALPRNYELISLEDLELPEFKKMAFRYTILEFNTAVKPWAIEKLFGKYDRVVYLDPDIYVYEAFNEINGLFDAGSKFIFTPHLTHLWKEDGLQPDEEYIMRAGVYNLGFIALAKCDEVLEMVKWWQRKLEYRCVVDIQSGVFVDQKWMDLVPGLFRNVAILQHDGYNVAYWNLSHRKCSKSGGKYFFNGQPLVFFHYSGFNINDPYPISKHQSRFNLDKVGVAKQLFLDYAEQGKKNSSSVFSTFKYAYNVFEDGTEIPDSYRYLYRTDANLQRLCGKNPFAAMTVFAKDYRRELLHWLVADLWNKRVDVREFFRVPGAEYLNWAKNELHLPDDMAHFFPDVASGAKYINTNQRVEKPDFIEWLKGIRQFISPRLYAFGKSLYHWARKDGVKVNV